MRRRVVVAAVAAALAASLGAGVTGPATAQEAPATRDGAAVRAEAARRATEDSLPRMDLEEALRRAAVRDPARVAARGRADEARWIRRASIGAFALPTVTAQTSASRFSSPSFNPGTASLTDELVQGSVDANLELFRGGGKLHELRRSGAALDRATAEEERARFGASLGTESDFYAVLAEAELARVAEERVRRAEEQLDVARARVSTGAAVQTDSLRLVLELTRARVELLRQRSDLRVARLQLGRRVGVGGPVDAMPPEADPPERLPISEEEAVAEALEASPRVRVVEAAERAADATLAAARSAYFPTVSLFGRFTGFDDTWPPDATTRGQWGLSVSLPLWDGGQREARVAGARGERDAARAVRSDEELAIRRDAIDAYQGYVTARASVELARRGVDVARENLRVEEDRYRSGATPILDLITAQVDLAEAEAELVRARFDARLALAGLEALLGRRLVTP